MYLCSIKTNIMKQEIKYGGYSVNRSDYDSVDGELSISMGMLNEEGQQRHIPQPKQLAEMPEGHEIMYIHKTANYTHYIVKLRTLQPHAGGLPLLVDKLYWLDESVITTADTLPVPAATVSENLHYIEPWYDSLITEITSVGNTLVVLAGDGMHYILWKGGETEYHYLGNHIPEVALSFGLQAHASRSEEFLMPISTTLTQQEIENVIDQDGKFQFDANGINEDMRNSITMAVMSKANKFIADEATAKGRFLYPFLVRYAYRLYDGSLTMHSSPVLMVANSELTPRAYITRWESPSVPTPVYEWPVVRIGGVTCDLDYQYLPDDNLLSEWGDIIQSVDVFISAPLYTYKQDGEVESIARTIPTGFTVAKVPSSDDTLFPLPSYTDYAMWRTAPMLTGVYDTTDGYLEFMLPQISKEEVVDAARNCSSFYLLKSIKPADLQTTRTKIDIGGEYLQGLVGREAMTDDYDSHDQLVPGQSFVYNSRLSIADITKKVLFPFSLDVYLQHTSGAWSYNGTTWTDLGTKEYGLQIYLEQNGKTYLSPEVTSTLANGLPSLYFYFHNPNATKFFLHWTIPDESREGVDVEVYKSYTLDRHNNLNGSFYFDSFDIDMSRIDTEAPPTYDADGNIITLPNKIYTSEVDNPFFFPVTSISTVGAGRIIGVSTAAKPLSEGQFGQFPLYAFTTEGVWSMQVGNTGQYTPGQPIIPDVALSRESIAQINDTVFFATKRGIMMIAGRDAQCVSDMLISDETFDISSLPHLADLLPSTLPTDISPFQEFVHGCRMSYDYLNQRIVVFNPTVGDIDPLYPYAYVLSTKSKLWGMMPCNLVKTLNSYPDALLQDLDGCLVTLSDTAEGSDSQHPVATSLILTRPLKLGDGNILKTIHVLVQRGKFRKGAVKTVLYGSRDLWSWHLVGSSTCHWLRGLRGSGYKYFRIALITTMAKDESVSGATVLFDPRYLGRLH